MRNVSLLACLCLAACTVGPKLIVPTVAVPKSFTMADGVQLNHDSEVKTWKAFRAPVLDDLIARALAENTSIAAAVARYDEAKAYRGLTKFSLFPTVTAAGDRTRNKLSSLDPQAPPDVAKSTSIDIGADVSYEIDLLGSLRNQSAAIILRQDAAGAALADVQRVIVAEVAQAYFASVGAKARMAIAEQNLAALNESERIVQALVEHGRSNDLDLARAQSLRLSVAATVPQLRAEMVRQQLRLASLTGTPVVEIQQVLATALPPKTLLVADFVGTPTQWLQRRPDVRAAALQFAAANRDVGTQIAEYFPKLTLLGSFGYVAPTTGGLYSASSERWRYGPSISWQFLNFGRVGQQVDAAKARVQGAAASYQEVLLRALEETEGAFANYRAANESAEALTAAATAAVRAADLARLRFDAGASDYLVVLDVTRQRLQLEDQALQAQTARASAIAQLYKALAGDFLNPK
jgi:outer membrane protein, multidrug efflux system